MSANQHESTAEPELTVNEVLGWLEFGCWVTLLLAPMLYFVNGPAVSTDQLVVRTVLVCLAAVGAVVLWTRRKWFVIVTKGRRQKRRQREG